MTIFKEFGGAGYQTPVTDEEITTGLFSGDTGSLVGAFTASFQKAISGEYYFDIYDKNPASDTTAEVQFAVSYGHVSGGGSPALTAAQVSVGNRPTQAIYSQYRNILLTSGSKFTFGTGTSATQSDHIYVINVNRARTKQALDPGNWQLWLRGTNGNRSFVDSSWDTTTPVYTNVAAASVYDIRSGSLSTTGATYADSTVYGLAFPDYGVLILDPTQISSSVGFSGNMGTTNYFSNVSITGPFAPYTGSDATQYQYQHEAVYRAIKDAITANKNFQARSLEVVSSKNYLVTLLFDEYNYTNNPTYYSIDSAGNRQVLSLFKAFPVVYITTIGLYNAQNELVAVAKLSRPLEKSKTKSLTIRVRLDY